MSASHRHDRTLLDALDVAGAPFSGTVWRIARTGRDPLKGSTLNGRWSGGGEFSVLYTSREKDGALAEIGYRLSLEPIWPSRVEHTIHELKVECGKVLDLSAVEALQRLGVDMARYQQFEYATTSKISAAACFLEFDGILVPSARFSCNNLVIYNERPNAIEIVSSATVDWDQWRKRR
jgi:hypothetical protein